MTRKASTKTRANEQAGGNEAESGSPIDPTKRRARPAAAPPPKAEPASKGGGPSRRDQLIQMLSTKNGTELAAISAKFGWLPHTTRAALSGLRKAGHAVIAEKRAGGKPTRYRIAGQAVGASTGDGLLSIVGPSTAESPSDQCSDVATPTRAPIEPATASADNGSASAASAA